MLMINVITLFFYSFTGKKNQGGSKRIVTPETTTFHLLHLSLLREYIDHEFGGYLNEPGVLEFGYNLENIIDDWILMGFLVGRKNILKLFCQKSARFNKKKIVHLFHGISKSTLDDTFR